MHKSSAPIQADALLAALATVERVAVRAPFVPDGADQPLLPVPASVATTEAERLAAWAAWDTTMDDYYTELWNAEVVEGEDDEDDDGSATWLWLAASLYYLRRVTRQPLRAGELVALRDDWSDLRKPDLRGIMDRLAAQEITIQQAEALLRAELRTLHINAATLGRGGRHAMTAADWQRVHQRINAQQRYLHRFMQQVAAGEKSLAQARYQASLYAEAASATYEEARAAAYGLILPAYPGDGTTECLTNCRCRWEIVDTGDAWRCFWRLARAEHCATCVTRAATWNPLEFAK